jgi:hypothetical protein
VRNGIDGARLARMDDADLEKLAESLYRRQSKVLFAQLKGLKEVCEDQNATMRRFDESDAQRRHGAPPVCADSSALQIHCEVQLTPSPPKCGR